MPTKRAVSLFSNCGAGDIGYKSAGFHFDVMAELDPRRLEICLLNHPEAVGIPGDLRDTWTQVVETYREKAGDSELALLAACPPCQGMSSARGSRGLGTDADAGMKDERNLLAVVIAKVAQQLQPQIIIVENVPAFLTRKVRDPRTNSPISAASLLISMLEDRYAVFAVLADLCEYGVPQTRKRTFLTLIRKDLEILDELINNNSSPFPLPTHAKDYGEHTPIALSQALQGFNLPSLDASTDSRANSDAHNGMHCVPVWRDRRYQMVAAIPSNSGASAWDNKTCELCGKDAEVNVDNFICPNCQGLLLKPIMKGEDGEYRLIKGFHASSYRRMHPQEPASTITTGSGHIGGHFTIHPFENRVFSPLECAYLQTIPTDFNWGEALKKWGHTNVRNMIGEAVPPLFTKLHGIVLMSILANKLPLNLLPRNNRRCRGAHKKLNIDNQEQGNS